jgi:hypothetical protein
VSAGLVVGDRDRIDRNMPYRLIGIIFLENEPTFTGNYLK